MQLRNSLRSFLYRILGKRTAFFLHRFYKHIAGFFSSNFTREEALLLKSVSGFIKQNTVAFDIGAHTGAWTKILSKLVGQNGIVAAFEPVPENYKALCKQIKRYFNVRCFNVALSDKQGSTEILIPNDTCLPSTGAIAHTADQLNDTNHWNRIKVQTERLDDLCESIIGPKKVSFIKCDVEGHEKQVFDGARDTISRFRPVIIVEILREKWKNGDPSESDAALFLKDLSYKIIQISDNGIQNNSKNFNHKYENFLFLPDDDSIQILLEYLNHQNALNPPGGKTEQVQKV